MNVNRAYRIKICTPSTYLFKLHIIGQHALSRALTCQRIAIPIFCLSVISRRSSFFNSFDANLSPQNYDKSSVISGSIPLLYTAVQRLYFQFLDVCDFSV